MRIIPSGGSAPSATHRARGVLLLAITLGALPSPARATPRGSFAPAANGDYLQVSNSPRLNPGGALTIEIWVRPSLLPSTAVTLVGKNFMRSYWLGLSPTHQIRFYTGGGLASRRDGSAAVPLGQWTHVAVTFDGTRRVYYLNGNVDLDQITPGSVGVDADPLGIGADFDGQFGWPGGSVNLAEVRIWRRALTRAEIRRDMIRQLPVDTPDLMAAWHLEAGPEEAGGRYPAIFVGATATPSFAGLAAPALPHDPLRVLRTASTPLVDGACSPAEYGTADRLPIWEDGAGASALPIFAFTGATASDLYLCLPALPLSSASGSGWVDLDFDSGGDGGATPQAGDFQFTLTESGAASSAEGTGIPLAPFALTSVPGFQGTAALSGEFA